MNTNLMNGLLFRLHSYRILNNLKSSKTKNQSKRHRLLFWPSESLKLISKNLTMRNQYLRNPKISQWFSIMH